MAKQMARFVVLIAIALIVILPTMAHRDKGYRGAWGGMMIVGLLVAVFSFRLLAVNMVLFHSTLTDSDLVEKFQKSLSEIDQTIVWSFVTFFCSVGFAIGSPLAVCFYRAKAAVTQTGTAGVG
jgi:hypothetical protein